MLGSARTVARTGTPPRARELPANQTMPNAVILANGFPPSRETLNRALARSSLFACADGGANTALRYGLTPDAIVGDIDSTDPGTLAAYHAVPLVREPDTERTDAEKAVAWVLRRGSFDGITLLGASAGRLDHVLGNLSLLHRYRDRARIVIEDDVMRAWLARGEETIDEPPGTVVSFFAVARPADGVTTQNLRYPLREKRLELGVQDSISNVVETRPARVRVATGEIIIIVNAP